VIQRRNPPGRSWSADLREDPGMARDLQSLLDLIARRYKLVSGILVTSAGDVRASNGELTADLQALARAIDPQVLPRYFANGPYDAYGDIVGTDLIALLMRERGSSEQPSELSMVSDYNVAKEMMEEVRAAVRKLTGGAS
jgi:hypothetical protein